MSNLVKKTIKFLKGVKEPADLKTYVLSIREEDEDDEVFSWLCDAYNETLTDVLGEKWKQGNDFDDYRWSDRRWKVVIKTFRKNCYQVILELEKV